MSSGRLLDLESGQLSARERAHTVGRKKQTRKKNAAAVSGKIERSVCENSPICSEEEGAAIESVCVGEVARSAVSQEAPPKYNFVKTRTDREN